MIVPTAPRRPWAIQRQYFFSYVSHSLLLLLSCIQSMKAFCWLLCVKCCLWSYELMYGTGVFIRKCLDNENRIVSSVARNGVFFQHMRSPIGRSAQCWSNFVGHSVHKMPVLSIRNWCFSECMTACLLRYSNESVCWENCFVCVIRILLPDFA